jgi:hypothetical protein
MMANVSALFTDSYCLFAQQCGHMVVISTVLCRNLLGSGEGSLFKCACYVVFYYVNSFHGALSRVKCQQWIVLKHSKSSWSGVLMNTDLRHRIQLYIKLDELLSSYGKRK